MVSQTEFTLRPRTRGFHLITDEVVRNLPPLPQTGLLYLFIKHTSAALSINENAIRMSVGYGIYFLII